MTDNLPARASSPSGTRRRGRGWPSRIAEGFVYYQLTTLVALLGVSSGIFWLRRASAPTEPEIWRPPPPAEAMSRQGGRFYKQIVERGYSFQRAGHSNAAYFPAFPALAFLVRRATGLSPEWALLTVAHLSLVLGFVTFGAYLKDGRAGVERRGTGYALAALGLFPTGCFFRFAYAESLFLSLSLAAMYGIERKWKPVVVALIVGAATAARPVGPALLAPFALYAFREAAARRRSRLHLLWLVPLASWGLFSFMAFQWARFGDPLAFATAQRQWRNRDPVTWTRQAWDLLTFEPVRAVYDESSFDCWDVGAFEPPWLNFHFAEPLFFLGAIALVLIGWRRAWLTTYETLFGAGMLAIPYVMRGHEMGMHAMGRFVAVVFPIYIVLGALLRRVPAPIAALFLALSAAFLFLYSAMFAAGYAIY